MCALALLCCLFCKAGRTDDITAPYLSCYTAPQNMLRSSSLSPFSQMLHDAYFIFYTTCKAFHSSNTSVTSAMSLHVSVSLKEYRKIVLPSQKDCGYVVYSCRAVLLFSHTKYTSPRYNHAAVSQPLTTLVLHSESPPSVQSLTNCPTSPSPSLLICRAHTCGRVVTLSNSCQRLQTGCLQITFKSKKKE